MVAESRLSERSLFGKSSTNSSEDHQNLSTFVLLISSTANVLET